MKVNAARDVGLPDAQLVDGQFLNIKEHFFSASGAYAHALPLLSRLRAKSRNGALLLHHFATRLSPPLSSTSALGSAGRRTVPQANAAVRDQRSGQGKSRAPGQKEGSWS